MEADLVDALRYLVGDAARNGRDRRECSAETVRGSLGEVLKLLADEYGTPTKEDIEFILESVV